MTRQRFSRRAILAAIGSSAVAGGLTVFGNRVAASSAQPATATGHWLADPPPKHQTEPAPPPAPGTGAHGGHGRAGMVGEVDHAVNGFNPDQILTDFDYGKQSKLADGQTLREYTIVAQNKTIQVAPGITYPAWTYNGRVPGPTIRCVEGDRVRITFINGSDHPHSLHFHGEHAAEMDGIDPIQPGGTFVYEFTAEPFGLHLYHCHVLPLASHIAKGLYGTFIIDPRDGYKNKADREYVMVMNAFDLDFDGVNEIYAVNSIPFHYDKHPIRFKVGELIRIFLVNILEYDAVNSFHLHANFFRYYPTGTSLTHSEFTDTIVLGQGQRGILELRYKHPGRYLFHAHKTEFAELGWVGQFEVAP